VLHATLCAQPEMLLVRLTASFRGRHYFLKCAAVSNAEVSLPVLQKKAVLWTVALSWYCTSCTP